jgi:hypothetical protein
MGGKAQTADGADGLCGYLLPIEDLRRLQTPGAAFFASTGRL